MDQWNAELSFLEEIFLYFKKGSHIFKTLEGADVMMPLIGQVSIDCFSLFESAGITSCAKSVPGMQYDKTSLSTS